MPGSACKRNLDENVFQREQSVNDSDIRKSSSAMSDDSEELVAKCLALIDVASDLISKCRVKFRFYHSKVLYRPTRPSARYSEVIGNSGANLLDDWKSFYAKELCGVLRTLVNGLDDAIYDSSSFLGPAYQSLLVKMDGS